MTIFDGDGDRGVPTDCSHTGFFNSDNWELKNGEYRKKEEIDWELIDSEYTNNDWKVGDN